MVALAGRSGAGKSTILNLLLRFRDPAEGTISIGGLDISDLSLDRLRSLIAYVPQDVHLFNETIADNVRLGRPDASPVEIDQACRLAQADRFIKALPDGYQTMCGENGAKLSGGERQRLAIARALLTNAPIILLDEASSNLDTQSERAFEQALASIRDGRTIVVIAHRPSTIRRADRIVVLKDGAIVEDGSHATLMALDGAYARLIGEEGQQPG
jgi:ATP-binding cassette subfamily C protein CydCD